MTYIKHVTIMREIWLHTIEKRNDTEKYKSYSILFLPAVQLMSNCLEHLILFNASDVLWIFSKRSQNEQLNLNKFTVHLI